MTRFFGNLSDQIDFDQLLSDLTTGMDDTYYAFNKDGSLGEVSPEEREYVEKIHKAGYQDPVYSNTIFYPYYHFSEDIIYKLDKIFGTICTMCWVNKLSTGKVIIPHRDFDDREPILEKFGVIRRFHIHIGTPQPGHVFILNEHAHYMEESGNCYEWNHHLDWHSASNSGLKSKYILSYRGLVPHLEHESRFKDYEYIWSDVAESVRIKIKQPVKLIL